MEGNRLEDLSVEGMMILKLTIKN